MIRVQMLTKFISNGGYLPELSDFGTFIKSTEVVRLIICKNLLTTPPNDPLPRDLRLCT